MYTVILHSWHLFISPLYIQHIAYLPPAAILNQMILIHNLFTHLFLSYFLFLGKKSKKIYGYIFRSLILLGKAPVLQCKFVSKFVSWPFSPQLGVFDSHPRASGKTLTEFLTTLDRISDVKIKLVSFPK